MPPSFSLLPVSDLTVLEAEHKRIVEMQAGLQAKYDDYKSMLTVFDRRVSEGDGSAASWASNCSEMVEQCKKDMRELEARRIKVLVEYNAIKKGNGSRRTTALAETGSKKALQKENIPL